MSKQRFLPAILLVFVLSSVAQQGEPKPAAADIFADEAFVFEQLITRARYEDDGTQIREQAARVRVQSDAGVQRLGQLIFGYNSENEQMQIVYARVRRADGSIISASASDVQDLPAAVTREAPMYSDFREKHITVPGLRPGEELEYQIVVRSDKPLIANHFWGEYTFEKQAIVLDEQFEANVPRDRQVNLKSRPGLDARISEEADRRIYRWSGSNRKHEPDEDRKKPKPKIPELPDIQLTTLRSWDEVGRWYWGLQKERITPTAAIGAKAQELIRGKTAELDKVEALYDFVATNFRYVSLSFGVGRYQPHAAGDILSNGYGDCKDKHTLLAALLESAGLHGYPVLISSSRDLDPDVPSPSQFDHVITAVPVGGGTIWMDTTTEVAPFQLLAAILRNKQALMIPADAPARLVTTPASPPFASRQIIDIDGKVTDLGKLEATVRQSSRGDNELALRMAFRRLPSSQWKQLVQTLNLYYGLAGEVSDIKADDPANTQSPFHFEYKVSQPNYLDWSPRRTQPGLFLPLMAMPEVDPDSAEKDGSPLRLGAPGEIVVRLKLTLPSKYVAHAPVPFAIKRDYGEYRATYSVDGNTVTAERALLTNVSELPASRARDYAAFRRTVRSDAEQKLSLESTASGKPSIPENAKADDLYESGLAALRNHNDELAIELLQRVIALEPKHKYAWNNLGRAYLGMRRTDDAIRAFQKQLEVNPYDEYAYDNLALAYWRQQKYEQAAEAFRKQLEVNPLDEFAYGSLGTMYVEWRKYADAVPAFEKAISLKPDNAFYQVGLGQAYLNLGQADKALEAFDKAVELQPAPGVWNNVAYELSQRKVHLDRAQEYAESAIAATAAALRNVSLDHLRMEDLGMVAALAAYWDTLGWIYFQKGDLQHAQEYINAAWMLDQHAEVGDHLAQVYERLGEKTKAERLYAMALSADRPIPETRGRLAALVGDKQVDPVIEKYRSELAHQRTLSMGPLVKDKAQAEFFVVLAAGQKVEGVKFIRGDDKLKPFASALATANYPAIFPEGAPTKVVRRGVLSCPASPSDCTFVLMVPEQVTSVD